MAAGAGRTRFFEFKAENCSGWMVSGGVWCRTEKASADLPGCGEAEIERNTCPVVNCVTAPPVGRGVLMEAIRSRRQIGAHTGEVVVRSISTATGPRFSIKGSYPARQSCRFLIG